MAFRDGVCFDDGIMEPALTAYRARWIVPVDARPIEQGVLVVSGGRIVRIAETWPGAVTDLGQVALIPGLVNCHTHLEFSDLPEPLSPGLPFTDWIRRVLEYRREHPSVVGQAIQKGLHESLAAGVTLVGDIASRGWEWTDYTSPRPRAIVFQELLGLSDERVTAARETMHQHAATETLPEGLSLGLSPHAPYSTHPQVFAAAVNEAQSRRLPVAVHLAETQAERELLAEATGEYRDFLTDLGLWREELFGGRSFADWLNTLAELPRSLVIHGNYLDAGELAILARSPQMALVYCPRTHAAFGHPLHPWQDLIAIGGTVALGTDSRATNPDLNLWRELQFLAERYPDVPHHDLLKLGTLAGAKALGLGRDCGSLTPGKRADIAMIALNSANRVDPVYQLLSPAHEVVGTMLAGRWVHGPLAESVAGS